MVTARAWTLVRGALSLYACFSGKKRGLEIKVWIGLGGPKKFTMNFPAFASGPPTDCELYGPLSLNLGTTTPVPCSVNLEPDECLAFTVLSVHMFKTLPTIRLCFDIRHNMVLMMSYYTKLVSCKHAASHRHYKESQQYINIQLLKSLCGTIVLCLCSEVKFAIWNQGNKPEWPGKLKIDKSNSNQGSNQLGAQILYQAGQAACELAWTHVRTLLFGNSWSYKSIPCTAL